MNSTTKLAHTDALTNIERHARQILRDVATLRTLRREHAALEAREAAQFARDCRWFEEHRQ